MSTPGTEASLPSCFQVMVHRAEGGAGVNSHQFVGTSRLSSSTARSTALTPVAVASIICDIFIDDHLSNWCQRHASQFQMLPGEGNADNRNRQEAGKALAGAQTADAASTFVQVAGGYRVIPNLTYLRAGGVDLTLDVYQPAGVDEPESNAHLFPRRGLDEWEQGKFCADVPAVS